VFSFTSIFRKKKKYGRGLNKKLREPLLQERYEEDLIDLVERRPYVPPTMEFISRPSRDLNSDTEARRKFLWVLENAQPYPQTKKGLKFKRYIAACMRAAVEGEPHIISRMIKEPDNVKERMRNAYFFLLEESSRKASAAATSELETELAWRKAQRSEQKKARRRAKIKRAKNYKSYKAISFHITDTSYHHIRFLYETYKIENFKSAM